MEKAKGLDVNGYSPLLKNSRSALECINEENSSENQLSQDSSAFTSDARYFSKRDYATVLTRSATSNDAQNKYSILAKRISNDDMLEITEKRMTKRRTTNKQPKQNLLQIDKKLSSKSPLSTFQKI